MNDVHIYCSDALRRLGADKFQCVLTRKKQVELNLEGTDMSLMRSTQDVTLSLMAIKDLRKGEITVNSLDQKSLDEAMSSLMELCATSAQDDAYDISPPQPKQHFDIGPSEPDVDRMYALLTRYADHTTARFPKVRLAETIFAHALTERHFTNSNGVDLSSRKGVYTLTSLFSAKDGGKTSSFNYSQVALADLEQELLQCSSFAVLLGQAAEQLEARALPGKFVGDVIITPDCLGGLLSFYVSTFLGDRALIAGTSLFKDKLGQKVAGEQLTFGARPRSPQIADGYAITSDGFVAEDVTLIERGVLKSFMLSLYGANKTKRERAKNSGDCFVVEAGDKTYAQLVAGVERGLLLARYSGGYPSANGDFSGVAKNSYYIENGKVLYPVNETMIAGNLAELFTQIKGISAERVNFGGALLPYVAAAGVTISGKH